MLPEGSQVQSVLRQHLVRALPGAARPSTSQHLLDVVLQQSVPQVNLLALVPNRFLVRSRIPIRSGLKLCRPIFLQLLRATRHHLVS